MTVHDVTRSSFRNPANSVQVYKITWWWHILIYFHCRLFQEFVCTFTHTSWMKVWLGVVIENKPEYWITTSASQQIHITKTFFTSSVKKQGKGKTYIFWNIISALSFEAIGVLFNMKISNTILDRQTTYIALWICDLRYRNILTMRNIFSLTVTYIRLGSFLILWYWVNGQFKSCE